MPPKRTASKPAAPAATPSPAQQLKTPSPAQQQPSPPQRTPSPPASRSSPGDAPSSPTSPISPLPGHRWRPDVLEGVKKQGSHLALDDIRDSINELRHYRDHFFKL